MTGNHDFADERCRFSSVCDAICDDNVPVMACPNYWKMDDMYGDVSYRNNYDDFDDEFYDDGDFEYEEDEW